MIERLHHAAYRCQDSEATRSFYEDFLGLPLTDAFVISETQTGRQTSVLDLAARQGIEHRAISDHGFIHSVYFRDPNGYVAELAADVEAAKDLSRKNDPHDVLADWGRN